MPAGPAGTRNGVPIQPIYRCRGNAKPRALAYALAVNLKPANGLEGVLVMDHERRTPAIGPANR
jgi:hypothetical protein